MHAISCNIICDLTWRWEGEGGVFVDGPLGSGPHTRHRRGSTGGREVYIEY